MTTGWILRRISEPMAVVLRKIGRTVSASIAARVSSAAQSGSNCGAAASSTTYVTAYPDGSDRPVASNLNLRPGVDAADLVTVAVGSGRALDLYVHEGTARLIVDVAGWYSSADPSATDVYAPMSPTAIPPSMKSAV